MYTDSYKYTIAYFNKIIKIKQTHIRIESRFFKADPVIVPFIIPYAHGS